MITLQEAVVSAKEIISESGERYGLVEYGNLGFQIYLSSNHNIAISITPGKTEHDSTVRFKIFGKSEKTTVHTKEDLEVLIFKWMLGQ